MSKSKKLSEQELGHIADCRDEGYPDPDDEMSRVLAIRDISRLLAHIDALETEHAALMTRAMKDADRVGNAYIEFTNQQTARIEALEKTIRKVIYGVRGIDLPCEKWVTAELSYILPGFDQIRVSDSSDQKANDPG